MGSHGEVAVEAGRDLSLVRLIVTRWARLMLCDADECGVVTRDCLDGGRRRRAVVWGSYAALSETGRGGAEQLGLEEGRRDRCGGGRTTSCRLYARPL